LERLRTPLFIIALILIAMVVLVETGSSLLGGGSLAQDTLQDLNASAKGVDSDFDQGSRLAHLSKTPPGMGIPYMAFVDGLLLFVVALQALAFLISDRVHGRVRGIIGLIVSFLILVGSFGAIIYAIGKLMVMIGLLVATPFGTIVYLALYGFFRRGQASIVLSLLMTMKLAFAVLLVLAHQRFLQIKSLVLLTLTSLLCNVIIGFLHALVPIFLVSITDGVAAIICVILALIWAIVFFVVSIIGIGKGIA
jgi:hypothetical protein